MIKKQTIFKSNRKTTIESETLLKKMTEWDTEVLCVLQKFEEICNLPQYFYPVYILHSKIKLSL